MAKKDNLTEELKKHFGFDTFKGNQRAIIENVLAGNAKLMKSRKITFQPVKEAGTVVYVAEDGKYRGAVLIEDEIKEDAAFAVSELKKAGVQNVYFLTISIGQGL